MLAGCPWAHGCLTIRCGAGKEMSQETRRLFQGEAPPSDFSVPTWPALNIQRFFLFYMSNITPIISTEPHKGICRVFFASHMEQHFLPSVAEAMTLSFSGRWSGTYYVSV